MFKKTILAHALTVAFMGAALTAGVSNPAMAQSNASGTIFGDATVGGASVLVRNLDTNLQRRVTADASGRYQVTALPVGRYKVEVIQGDKVVNTSEVDVIAGQGA
ncbi:carboxypeptidase-like regulatory domain-containing protein [Massilia sp. TWP1-3-3]|uniref:carboxypeptidase-like regulatory domain-containing protein n=1 Tax=Massilia sp. TWP1-3-3 TaxID=2804573 RepID=UPI003CE74068